MRHHRLLLSIGASLAVVTALAAPASAHGSGGDRAEGRAGTSMSHGKGSHGHSLKARGDRDRDGLSNRRERRLGTNPFDADTDDDGLRDGLEIRLRLNPRDSDSDNDGIADGVEDRDGDGICNLDERFAVGVVKSFAADGRLTIDPNGDGADIVVTVDDDTDIDVASRYSRHHGWHRSSMRASGDFADDGDGDEDAADLLVAGAVVLKLKVADDQSVTRILLAPATR